MTITCVIQYIYILKFPDLVLIKWIATQADVDDDSCHLEVTRSTVFPSNVSHMIRVLGVKQRSVHLVYHHQAIPNHWTSSLVH